MRLGGPVFRWEDDPELFARRHQEKGYRAATCPKFLKCGRHGVEPKVFAGNGKTGYYCRGSRGLEQSAFPG